MEWTVFGIVALRWGGLQVQVWGPATPSQRVSEALPVPEYHPKIQ